MTFDLSTFVLELVNFLVLAWILTRFVYRPIASAIQERRDELAAVREEAAQKLEEVETRAAELDARDHQLDRLREKIIDDATTKAAQERARMLAQARQDASAERERVEAMLESEREAAVAWVRDEAVDRGLELAGRLLVGLAPDEAHAALVRRLADELRRQGDRLALPDGGPQEVDLTMAHSPEPEELALLRGALEEALGSRPRLSTHEDEELGAGAVIRIGDRVLDASVRGQLDLLRTEARRQLEAG